MIWRWRRNGLAPNRDLACDIVPMDLKLLEAAINGGANLGLHVPDLDYKNKQDWYACLRMTGLNDKGRVQSTIIETLSKSESYLGLVQYLKLGRYFIQIFVNYELAINEKLRYCGYILGTLALMRLQNRKSNDKTITHNCMTNETFVDIVTSVSSFVLLVTLLRQMLGEHTCALPPIRS